MKIELITPESGPSRRLRKWRLIRFPQLTMPLLAAYTPPGVELHHTDEIVEPVDLDRDADLVAITCNTPAAPHSYRRAQQLRPRGRRVVLGGPHVTAMPSDALRHADALVIGEGDLVWPEVVNDFARGRWQEIYRGRPADWSRPDGRAQHWCASAAAPLPTARAARSPRAVPDSVPAGGGSLRYAVGSTAARTRHRARSGSHLT